MVNMKSLLKIAGVILVIIFLEACGANTASMSAPPVELPAPVTGRITVSEPDGDGNVSITGTEGAVTSSSLVLATNETIAGVQVFNILDLFIKSAHAAGAFPTICSEVGRACAWADADGSFEITLAAEEGDSIIIGMIDSTSGDYEGDVIRREAGDEEGGSATGYSDDGDDNSGDNSDSSGDSDNGGDSTSTNCSSEGVNGAVVDIGIVPGEGTPVALKQGSATNLNQLAIGSNPTIIIDIAGCHAHSLAMTNSSSSNNIIVAVTSYDDKTLWTGELSGTVVSSPASFTLTDSPGHAIFSSTEDTPIVSMYNGTTVYLAKLSLEDGSSESSLALTRNEDQITGITESASIDLIDIGASLDKTLGMILTHRTALNDSYITLFWADEFAVLHSWNTVADLTMEEATDALLYADTNGEHYILTLDSNNGVPNLVSSEINADMGGNWFPLTANTVLDNVVEWLLEDVMFDYIYDNNQNSIPITNITIINQIGSGNNLPYVVGASSDGRILVSLLNQAATPDINTLVAGSTFIDITSDQSSEKVYVTTTSDFTEVSENWLPW